MYPTDVVERSGSFRSQVDAQLMKFGITSADLPYAIGHTAKTTIPNRIRSGNLTLNDMLWIADYGFDVDWTNIIASLKDAKERKPIPKLADVEEVLGERAAKELPPKPVINKDSAKAKRFSNLLIENVSDDAEYNG